MKNLICLLSLLLASSVMHAQDTLVSTKGIVIPAYRLSSDSTFVYYSTDTSTTEMNMRRKSELLLIKYRNGNSDVFFENDTVVMTNGVLLMCKVLEIAPEGISTFTKSAVIREPAFYPSSSVIAIHYHNGTMETIAHPEQKNTMSENEYYKLGQRDAKKYFRTSPKAIAGEVACGMGTYIYMIGILPAAIIASKDPKDLSSPMNPNDELLSTNRSYHDGYLKESRRKKSKDCWIAYGCGFVAPVAIIVGAIVYINTL